MNANSLCKCSFRGRHHRGMSNSLLSVAKDSASFSVPHSVIKHTFSVKQEGLLHGPRFDRDCDAPQKFRINPLSPRSGQHQFSPNNIHTLSGDKVVRINKMITKEKMP